VHRGGAEHRASNQHLCPAAVIRLRLRSAENGPGLFRKLAVRSQRNAGLASSLVRLAATFSGLDLVPDPVLSV